MSLALVNFDKGEEEDDELLPPLHFVHKQRDKRKQDSTKRRKLFGSFDESSDICKKNLSWKRIIHIKQNLYFIMSLKR